jgi:hypothetical protein
MIDGVIEVSRYGRHGINVLKHNIVTAGVDEIRACAKKGNMLTMVLVFMKY